MIGHMLDKLGLVCTLESTDCLNRLVSLSYLHPSNQKHLFHYFHLRKPILQKCSMLLRAKYISQTSNTLSPIYRSNHIKCTYLLSSALRKSHQLKHVQFSHTSGTLSVLFLWLSRRKSQISVTTTNRKLFGLKDLNHFIS